MRGRLAVRLALVASFSLVAASCTVGPDYRRPAIEAPSAYARAGAPGQGAADAAGVVNVAWWRQFGDPVLDGLVAEAVASNKDLQIAAAKVESAAAVLAQTRAPLLPQVAYDAAGTRARISETGAAGGSGSPASDLVVKASASWELDLWGRVRRLAEASRATLLATEEARRGVLLSLVASVATGYLDLRGLDEMLLVARRSHASYGEAVRIFELQFRYGLVSQMTVEQARTQHETAAAEIPQIESEIVRTENALAILLGRSPGPIGRGRTIHELTLPPVPAGLPSSLLESRPDLREAEQNLVAANARIGAARALYFPSISLTGLLGTASADLSDLFRGPSKTWSFGGSITGPIFRGGEIAGQVRQAEADRKAALLSYRKAVESAFADVENALSARAKLAEELAARVRLVRAAREYERLATLQYRGGYAPYSTVLQAQEKLLPAELDLARTRTKLFGSLVTLYEVTGGGWVAEADRQAAAPGAPPGPAAR